MAIIEINEIKSIKLLWDGEGKITLNVSKRNIRGKFVLNPSK